jgi:hypothetical protein
VCSMFVSHRMAGQAFGLQGSRRTIADGRQSSSERPSSQVGLPSCVSAGQRWRPTVEMASRAATGTLPGVRPSEAFLDNAEGPR